MNFPVMEDGRMVIDGGFPAREGGVMMVEGGAKVEHGGGWWLVVKEGWPENSNEWPENT